MSGLGLAAVERGPWKRERPPPRLRVSLRLFKMLSPNLCATRAALKLQPTQPTAERASSYFLSLRSFCVATPPHKFRRVMWRHELQKRRLQQPQIRKEFLASVHQPRLCASSPLARATTSASANGSAPARLFLFPPGARHRSASRGGWSSKTAFKRLQRRWTQWLAVVSRRCLQCVKKYLERQLALVQLHLQRLWAVHASPSAASPPQQTRRRRGLPVAAASGLLPLASLTGTTRRGGGSGGAFSPRGEDGLGGDCLRRILWQDALETQTAEAARDGSPERGYFFNAQGLRIRVYRWRRAPTRRRLPQTAAVEGRREAECEGNREDGSRCRGVFLFVHGYGEHCRSHFLSRPPPRPSPLSAVASDSDSEEKVPSALSTASTAASASAAAQSEESAASEGPTAAESGEDAGSSPGGDYCGSWVERLNALGFDVWGLDLQGHGESEGWRGPKATAPIGAAAAVAAAAWQNEGAGGGRVLRDPSSSSSSSSGVAHLGQTESAFAPRGLVRELQDFAVDVLSFVWLVKEEYRRQQQARQQGSVATHGEEPPPLFLVGLSMGGWASLRAVQLAAELRFKATRSIEQRRQGPSSSTPNSTRRGGEAEVLSGEEEADFAAPPSAAQNAKAGLRRALGFVPCSARAASAAASAAGLSEAAAREGLGLRGLVLLSPMLDLSRQKNKIKWNLLRPAAAAAAALAPSIPVAFPPRRRRHFPHLLDHYWADPLTLKNGMLLGLAIAAFLGVDAATDASALRRVGPQELGALFVCHHQHDPLCGVSGALNCCFQMEGIRDRTLCLLGGKEAAASSASRNHHNHHNHHNHQQAAAAALRRASTSGKQAATLASDAKTRSGGQRVAPEAAAASAGASPPRVIELESVDLLHDLTVEPDQHRLFDVLKSWTLERCDAETPSTPAEAEGATGDFREAEKVSSPLSEKLDDDDDRRKGRSAGAAAAVSVLSCE